MSEVSSQTSSGKAVGGLGGTTPERAYLESLAGPLRTLSARQHLSALIQKGSIDEAIVFYQQQFPSLYQESSQGASQIHFLLSSQAFIERVQRSQTLEALEYAQKGSLS